MSKIIQNAIRIKEYDVIIYSNSKDGHNEYKGYFIADSFECVRYILPDGKTSDDIELLTIMDNDSTENMMKKLIWGTYGKDGKSKLKIVKLFDCESDHLIQILSQQSKSDIYVPVIKSILEYRSLIERNEKILKIKKQIDENIKNLKNKL